MLLSSTSTDVLGHVADSKLYTTFIFSSIGYISLQNEAEYKLCINDYTNKPVIIA